MSPSSLAVAAVAVVAGSTILRKVITREGNTTEVIVFALMLLVALMFMALVVPNVTAVLSYVAMVGAFIVNGPVIFASFAKFGNTPTTPAAKSATV